MKSLAVIVIYITLSFTSSVDINKTNAVFNQTINLNKSQPIHQTEDAENLKMENKFLDSIEKTSFDIENISFPKDINETTSKTQNNANKSVDLNSSAVYQDFLNTMQNAIDEVLLFDNDQVKEALKFPTISIKRNEDATDADDQDDDNDYDDDEDEDDEDSDQENNETYEEEVDLADDTGSSKAVSSIHTSDKAITPKLLKK